LPLIYAFYTLVMVLMPLTTGSIKSMSRYYLIVFPVFILLALWSSRGKEAPLGFVMMNIFVALQAVLMIFFVLGLPAIA
jgi:hypothetical protein